MEKLDFVAKNRQ